jgi:lysozyme
VGGGAFKASTLLRLLNQEQYGEVPAQLQRWNRAGGKVVQGLIHGGLK